MRWEELRRWCPQVQDLFAPGDSWENENPLRERTWTAPDGTAWRRRGDGELDVRGTRRLLGKRSPRVFHVDDTVPHEHMGEGLTALVAVLEEFWAGRLDENDDFQVGEFRSPAGGVALVVVQSC